MQSNSKLSSTFTTTGEGPGRPRYVADIDFAHDPDQELYDRFYEACREFCYRDVMALSRGLKVTPRTIYNWKNGKTFPIVRGTALMVIDWVAGGKRMKQEQGTRPAWMI